MTKIPWAPTGVELRCADRSSKDFASIYCRNTFSGNYAVKMCNENASLVGKVTSTGK